MNSEDRRVRLSVIAALLGLTFVFRFVPLLLARAGYSLEGYPFGFSPMLPICLFGGACLGRRWMAFLAPLGVWLAGDMALAWIRGDWGSAFYGSQAFTYLGFVASIVAGLWLRGRVRGWSVVVTGLLAAVAFFLISNFGAWLTMTAYAKTPAGLWECYVMALPFYRYTLLSQIVFLPMLFSPVTLRRREPAVGGAVAS